MLKITDMVLSLDNRSAFENPHQTSHLKILHTEWSDGWGGQEIRIMTEMEEMRRRGIAIALACRSNSQISRAAQTKGFPVYHFPFRSNFDIKTIAALYALIRREGFTIVNTHSGKDTWVGGIAARLAGVKFIRTRHLSNRINSSRLNFINQLAHHVVTTGESVRQDMIRFNRIDPSRCTSIPTGVDADRFDPNKYDKVESRRLLGLPEDAIIIGNLGVLRSFKRQDLFIQLAVELAPKLQKRVVFAIAGEGPKRNELESQIHHSQAQNYAVLLGHVSQPEVFLAAIDIFCLTSDGFEGVPQSLIQALMMGKPSIAADIGSIRDLWNDGNFVLLEEHGKDKYLSAIKEMLDSLIDCHQNTAAVRNTIANKLNNNVMTEKMLRVYS
ncbi:glycosyltransferase [Chrysiogenes arsenatis]|uniref:glycosyltransferase n=1 Tax=Chrysiogenes arsenatis TaxID=309797 RepID=UPI0003F4BFC1|nr:glycosyltransferase [Chrysiogenes arsenatis]